MTRTWFTLDAEEALTHLEADAEVGLSDAEVARRLRRYGPNALGEHAGVSWRAILYRQFQSVVVGLLAAAAVLSFAFGQHLEAGAILGVLVLNTALGFVTELRAQRSMEALRRLVEVTTKVIREGDLQEVPARELVPGDLLALEAGDLVSADARVLQASAVAVDEAPLTGESVPVEKLPDALADPKTPLAERANMLFRGTTVVRGAARAVVVATGAETELGQVAQLVEEAGSEETPLQRRLEVLGRNLIWVTLAVAVVVVLAGVWTGKDMLTMVETAVALAVAAIPEGLPVVATIALAVGLREMARKKALVSKLDAVETLGSTGLIATDKTGTLTENSMRVVAALLSGERASVERTGSGSRLVTGSGPVEATTSPVEDMLLACVLCNNAAARMPDDGSEGWETVGDPTEAALLILAHELGTDLEVMRQKWPREREVPFDSKTQRMSTVHRTPAGKFRAFVKGAPERVLPACTAELGGQGTPVAMRAERRQDLQHLCADLAQEGLRVLALAAKDLTSADDDTADGLSFLGAVGLLDPARADVSSAIADCQRAGVRVVMVTGDQVATASYIARQVGILTEGDEALSGRELTELSDEELSRRLDHTAVFARVTPADKLRIVRAFQAEGRTVAVFGDGVNDAPALKQAHIGVVMGMRGTQVAKEAGDLILQDDRLATIVGAIEGGRVIFRNLRKFVVYLLSCNISEVMIVLAASLVRMPMPLKPLQILWLNMVTDVFPALALGMERYPGDAMAQKPRPRDEPFIGPSQYRSIIAFGSLMAATVLSAFLVSLWMLRLPEAEAVTVAFFSLALSQLFFVVSVKASRGFCDRRALFSNRYVWLSIVGCGLLLVAAGSLPGLRTILHVEILSVVGWLTVLCASLVPVGVGLCLSTVRALLRGSRERRGRERG